MCERDWAQKRDGLSRIDNSAAASALVAGVFLLVVAGFELFGARLTGLLYMTAGGLACAFGIKTFERRESLEAARQSFLEARDAPLLAPPAAADDSEPSPATESD